MSIKIILSHFWAPSFLYFSVSTPNQKQNVLVQKISLQKAYTFYFSTFVYIATASFNPITHEEFTGEGLPPQHYQHAAPVTASFNPIMHEEFTGKGLPPQHYRHAAPPQTNPHAYLLDRENYGRRDTHKGI